MFLLIAWPRIKVEGCGEHFPRHFWSGNHAPAMQIAWLSQAAVNSRQTSRPKPQRRSARFFPSKRVLTVGRFIFSKTCYTHPSSPTWTAQLQHRNKKDADPVIPNTSETQSKKKKDPSNYPERDTAFELLQILIAVTYRWLGFGSEQRLSITLRCESIHCCQSRKLRWVFALLHINAERQQWQKKEIEEGGVMGGCVDACLIDRK